MGKEQSWRGTSCAGFWRGPTTTSFSTQKIGSSCVFLVVAIQQSRVLAVQPSGIHALNEAGGDCYIKHKEAAVTGGGTFHVQCGEKQKRRMLALHSKAVPSFPILQKVTAMKGKS